ncbi:MAG: hypothetical protein M3Y03_01130 [Verrucomicrobiota bacterium]|nr:hypothetical protein [Verrucomicrobiota bacterium]
MTDFFAQPADENYEESRMSGLTRPNRTATPGGPRRGEFVSVAGQIESWLVEQSPDPRKVDHVWLEVRAGGEGLIRVALSTCSLKNRDAGFDPRVRLGSIVLPWTELPTFGVRTAPPLDYAVIEATTSVVYLEHEQAALEKALVRQSATRGGTGSVGRILSTKIRRGSLSQRASVSPRRGEAHAARSRRIVSAARRPYPRASARTC